jgi:hypothetical protein
MDIYPEPGAPACMLGGYLLYAPNFLELRKTEVHGAVKVRTGPSSGHLVFLCTGYVAYIRNA